ncbi:MAG: helix-turn-helix domain-containing protein [Pseudonocardiaceae bacterium]|nr:helix-turn-helix domain-containing protein [Pseudonocardiaceae bacterium]
MGATDDSTIGRRARTIRRRRGLSVEVAAGLAGISTGYLSLLERGLRRFQRRGLLEDLAGALGCSVADLTGQPYVPVDRDTADALSALPAIREALHSYGSDEVPDVTPRPLAQLTRWAAEANEHTTQARYSLAGRNLGAVLTELTAHAHTAAASERALAATAAVVACFAAGVLASRTGHADLAVAAAQRGYELAAHHDDAAGLGFARWYWAMELTSVAARDRAHAVAAVGLDELTGSVSTGHTADTRPAEVAGMLNLQQARAAARHHRADDAHAHLSEAADLADRIGERNGFGLHFGPTNVAAWRLAINIELGEGARAAEDFARAPVDVAALESAERSSSLHLDMARALSQHGAERDAEAIRHLDTADRIAPSRTRPDPIARELVETLARRARRRVWELDSLRNRFGVN